MIDLCLERDYKRRPTAGNILTRPSKSFAHIEIQELISQFGIDKTID